MHLFRVRLILALIASVTLVSVASTYFDVLAHRHVLREDLERRTKWMGISIEPDVLGALRAGDPSALPGLMQLLKSGTGALGLAIYDTHGNIIASSGSTRSHGGSDARGGGKVTATGNRGRAHSGMRANGNGWKKHFRFMMGTELEGAMAIVTDASYIRSEANRPLAAKLLACRGARRSDRGRHAGMVRWFLLRPMSRVAERMRRLRTGHAENPQGQRFVNLVIFSPLAREVETMAESSASGTRRSRSGSSSARGRRAFVDCRAIGGSHSQSRRFQPHFRGLESRAVYARPARAARRSRRAAQRAGDRD